jgi:hypothetical protein
MVSNGNDTKGAIEQALVDAKDKVANAKTDKVDKVAPVVEKPTIPTKPLLFQDVVANRILALKGDKSDAEWINSFASAMRAFSKGQGKLDALDIGPSIALLCKTWNNCTAQEAIASAKALPPIVVASMSKELQGAISAIVSADDKAQQIVNDVQSAFGDILDPYALNAKPNDKGDYVVTSRRVSVGAGKSPSRDTLDFPDGMKVKKVLRYKSSDWSGKPVNVTPATTLTSGTSSGQWCAISVWNDDKSSHGNRTTIPSVADGPLTYTKDGSKYVRWNDDKTMILGKYKGYTFEFILA